jgi:uncharacterized protein
VAERYLKRIVDELIGALISELPALLLVGPRATGKTTTARRYASTIIQLDREAEAVAFRADPDAALRGLEEPVLLDEWQAVPGVLGAVKRTIDRERRPGRYLLTGSVRAELEADSWPGTGRLVRIPMAGLTVRELLGKVKARPALDRLAEEGVDALGAPASPPDLRDYVELALRSGFPDIAPTPPSVQVRDRWLESYIDQMLARDVAHVSAGRDPEKLRRYFEALALNSAGVVEHKTLHDAAGINRKTADAYDRLFQDLRVLELVPAWSSNRLKRLVRSPKRYLVDPALATGVLRMDVDAVLRDGDLLGRILETFVAGQLRAELPVCSTRPRIYHLRQEQGRHEIDLLAELSGRRIVAFEVKADAAPGAQAARHLRWLRDEIGSRFVAGIVLHTGPRRYSLDDRIVAAPICALWA